MSRVALYGGAVLLAAGVAYILIKKKPSESLGRAAVNAVEGVAVGAVKGVGSVFGIPDTNNDQCSKDLAAGRMWDASFSCPAGRFISDGVFNGTTTANETQNTQQTDYLIEREIAQKMNLGNVYNPVTSEEVMYDQLGNRLN